MLKVSRHHRGELAWSFSLFLLKPKQNKHLPRNSIYTFLWIDVFFILEIIYLCLLTFCTHWALRPTSKQSEWKSLSHVWLFWVPTDYTSPWNSPGQNPGVGSLSLLQEIFPAQQGWTQVSRIAGRFFTSWTSGKPKNTRAGSLFLCQQILPAQESNRGLLHCRRILYLLNYQGTLQANFSLN